MASAPERSCAVCRKRFSQAQLQRWVVVGGQAQVDTQIKQDGRGYYSCPGCVDKAQMVITAKHAKRSE